MTLRMFRNPRLTGVAAAMALVACALTFATTGSATSQANSNVDHVLLLSLDGFHDFDLTNYIAAHPTSALGEVVARGRRYANASAQVPSDSFPGTLAMTTGGGPKSTGVYYDVSWDNNLSPAGSTCTSRGALVPYNQTINFNANLGDSVADINPAKLPRDPDNGCTVVYPHQYLKVNTIYEVAHTAGLRTAVADKHPSYEILSGPSGTGIDDFYGPEFNAAKSEIAKIMVNDELKVAAVLNQIDGHNHQGTARVGVPAIFGMNFQAPNIGQKFSGYVDGTTTPQDHAILGPGAPNPPGLAQALDYVDGAIGRMLDRLDDRGLTDETMIILTAKHGNSPVDQTTLKPIDPAIFAPLINSVQPGLTAQVTADTMALIWLKDRSRAADVAAVLQAKAPAIGADTITSGADVATLFGGQLSGNPSRIPDIVVQPVAGVVYAAAGSKLVDHGSASAEDTHVPLVVVEPGREGAGTTLSCPVSLRQIAPTILKALGLKEKLLDAVRLEGTQRLPDTDECG
jgi:Type I phosphodiesterase / nucleotide pyrophosphatase